MDTQKIKSVVDMSLRKVGESGAPVFSTWQQIFLSEAIVAALKEYDAQANPSPLRR